jgi:hypothetical protein
MAGARETFVKSAARVRPLPSNASMILICAAVFAVLSVLLTMPIGFPGLRRMSMFAAGVNLTVLLLLVLVLAGGVVTQMIPGSRRVLPAPAAALISIGLLSLTALLLFPDFAMRDFVHRGMPCLRVGVLCSVPAAIGIVAFMRRGFIIDPISAAIAGGSLAGLLGVTVLALHCPIFEAAHVIAWHFGAIVITSLGGGFLGWMAARYR